MRSEVVGTKGKDAQQLTGGWRSLSDTSMAKSDGTIAMRRESS
jgi:hypothetical protein